MVKYNLFIKIIVFFLVVLIISGCSTLEAKYDSETAYEIFKDSKKTESILKVKIDKKGNKFGELSSKLISPAVIIGEVIEDQTGDINFIINSIKYLSNWPNGWTQGESEASGIIIFNKEDKGWGVNIKEDFEIWEATKGEIRYYDEYYRKESGLKKVNNRMKRINAVIEFLKKQEFVELPEFFGHVKFNSAYGKSLKNTIRPFLFPETMGIDKLKRKNLFPVDYNIPIMQKGDLIFKSGIFWRKSYTDSFFPDYLRELRNSGTLWRDYEEAIHLFYMLYNMDYYFKNVLQDASFIKVK